MTGTWQELESAFQAAIALDGAERAAFVAECARTDPELGRRLRELLAADADDDSALRRPVAAAVESLALETEDPWVGRRVGPWLVVRRLAAGGMGAVFLAERADSQYAHRVALKVMASQLLGPEAVARFRAERQILATLNHPYVARLIDGGSTDEGLPFLAMEYVDGEPIDAWCDQRQLGLVERLELFVRVCEAVDYAHRNLVVHRDLKPGNILVDANGTPKLLDFGIAKLIEATPAIVGLTRAGAQMLTPEYASPEQVRGQAVTVVTDVYALGVLLFRLLTGESPYGASPASSPVEYARAILETPPRRPSTAVGEATVRREFSARTGEVAGAISDAARQRLRWRLAGDLDNIVLQALQKEPERRYPTVSAFAEDVGRFLRHEPVAAHGDGFAYRARLFVRRNTREVAAAASVFVAIATMVAVYTVQLANERDRAELAAAQAQEVSTFLVDLFRSASPWRSQGRPVTATDLLDRGRERIDTLEPEALRAELSRIMGTSYSTLDVHDQALPLLKDAVRLREARPDEPLRLADALLDLGEAQLRIGDFALAEASMVRTIALRESVLGRENAAVAEALGRLGNVLYLSRRTVGALEVLTEAREIKERLGERDPVSIDILGNIGIVLDTLGRTQDAERTIREAATLSREIEGPMSPDTLTRENNLGLVLVRLGRYEEATRVHADVDARARRVFPMPHTQKAIATSSYAAALRQLGRFEEAEPLFREACEIVREAVGERSAAYVSRLWALGLALLDMARYADAEATLRRAAAIAQQVDGGQGSNSLVIGLLLGRALLEQGLAAEAEPLLRRAAFEGTTYSAEARLNARQLLAQSLSRQGEHAEALALIDAALEEQAAASGAESAPMLLFVIPAAAIHLRAGAVDEALALAMRAEAIATAVLPQGHWRAALATEQHADALVAAGRPAEARPLYATARASLERTFGADDPRVRRLAAALARSG
jgi:eukaryotic-like serine/threonine-protein kinase